MLGVLPNVHPAPVHFPVALFSTALAFDAASFWLEFKGRAGWLEPASMCLYFVATAAAVAAAITGQVAANAKLAEEVVPELEAAIGGHSDWAFFTVLLFLATTALRLDQRFRKVSDPRATMRRRAVGLVVASFAALSLWQAASRGGYLVYRLGVGVERGSAVGSGEPPGASR